MKTIEIKPPNWEGVEAGEHFSIFLAGSIEMDSAEKWQEKVVKELDDYILAYDAKTDAVVSDLMFFNPRRDDWDSSWTHNSLEFQKQVLWELDYLDKADLIVMYFDPSTKSPISLLELGLYAQSRKLIVCCPDGFWRKGNVMITCGLYNVPVYESYAAWMSAIKQRINSKNQ